MKNNLYILFVIIFFNCSRVQPRRPINPKPSTTIFTETAKEYKSLIKIEENKILDFIKKDSTNKYIQSKSGFWYTYINRVEDSLLKPKVGDEVSILYDIKSLNDSIIYSTNELGIKKYVVDKENFISALQKGIKLMKKGEIITFVIPSYAAFGIAGDGNKIGINQSIKSTVKLININNKK